MIWYLTNIDFGDWVAANRAVWWLSHQYLHRPITQKDPGLENVMHSRTSPVRECITHARIFWLHFCTVKESGETLSIHPLNIRIWYWSSQLSTKKQIISHFRAVHFQHCTGLTFIQEYFQTLNVLHLFSIINVSPVQWLVLIMVYNWCTKTPSAHINTCIFTSQGLCCYGPFIHKFIHTNPLTLLH